MSEKQPLQLQKPKWVYFGGRVRLSEEAVFHVSTEAVVRGLNVFEGLKACWQADGSFGFIAVERHWRRLRRSAKLLHIPFEMSLAEFDDALHSLVQMLYEPERDMWVRATLYVTEGHWGVDTKSDLVLTAFHWPKGLPQPMKTGISTWQRATDASLPYRIKTSTNYQVARLAKIEGRDRGYPEMVLLNQHGRVSETIGSAIAMVRDGTVYTPPAWEGAFESITIDIVEALCADMGIPFVRRPIDRTELTIADEMGIISTLNDVTLVHSIDGSVFGEQPILQAIGQRYRRAITGEEPHPSVALSCRPPADRLGPPRRQPAAAAPADMAAASAPIPAAPVAAASAAAARGGERPGLLRRVRGSMAKSGYLQGLALLLFGA